MAKNLKKPKEKKALPFIRNSMIRQRVTPTNRKKREMLINLYPIF